MPFQITWKSFILDDFEGQWQLGFLLNFSAYPDLAVSLSFRFSYTVIIF